MIPWYKKYLWVGLTVILLIQTEVIFYTTRSRYYHISFVGIRKDGSEMWGSHWVARPKMLSRGDLMELQQWTCTNMGFKSVIIVSISETGE